MSHATHLPDDHGHAAHPDAGHDHGGIAKYVYVFLALCFLTTMSFFTYSDLWPWPDAAVKRLFMTAVSCTKAMLVILFFMHVKYEANWKYVLTIPASIMSVFLCLALVPDIGARVNGLFSYRGRYSEERWEHVGREEDVEVMVTASKHGAAGHAGSEAEAGDGSEAAAIAAEHGPAIEIGPDDTKARAADVKEGSRSGDEDPADGEEPSDEGDEADRSAATRKAVPGITTSGDDADEADER